MTQQVKPFLAWEWEPEFRSFKHTWKKKKKRQVWRTSVKKTYEQYRYFLKILDELKCGALGPESDPASVNKEESSWERHALIQLTTTSMCVYTHTSLLIAPTHPNAIKWCGNLYMPQLLPSFQSKTEVDVVVKVLVKDINYCSL